MSTKSRQLVTSENYQSITQAYLPPPCYPLELLDEELLDEELPDEELLEEELLDEEDELDEEELDEDELDDELLDDELEDELDEEELDDEELDDELPDETLLHEELLDEELLTLLLLLLPLSDEAEPLALANQALFDEDMFCVEDVLPKEDMLLEENVLYEEDASSPLCTCTAAIITPPTLNGRRLNNSVARTLGVSAPARALDAAGANGKSNQANRKS
ncbi:unnamed protein product [Aureobasidium mustum]|uniref:Uncharacterized protein n=1 Tax=Aureobasidium mustum TaxID=2773714 RepID=A0A9N8JQX8_9PEZI|nr:unnamed protein product [Aureobasidium mustum]